MKRQGDILFERVASTPVDGLRVVESGIIALGETTGHAHRVAGDAQLRGWGNTMVVEVGAEGGAIVHEEHDRVELEPGVWQVHRQVEYVAPGETTQVYD